MCYEKGYNNFWNRHLISLNIKNIYVYVYLNHNCIDLYSFNQSLYPSCGLSADDIFICDMSTEQGSLCIISGLHRQAHENCNLMGY
jgi:hypothetical protein